MLPVDAELPPNTIIHLPPAARRSIGETGGLVILLMIGLVILWMAVKVAQMPEPAVVAPTRPEPAPVVALSPKPMIITVIQATDVPSATATPDVHLTPSPTPTGYCATSTPNQTVCTLPPVPVTMVPPHDCNDPIMSAGDQCTWIFTPTPTATPKTLVVWK